MLLSAAAAASSARTLVAARASLARAAAAVVVAPRAGNGRGIASVAVVVSPPGSGRATAAPPASSSVSASFPDLLPTTIVPRGGAAADFGVVSVRSFSSTDENGSKKKKVVDVRRGVQKEIWDKFLSTGSGAEALFDELDLNYSKTISVSEINYFLESVDRKGVSDRAFEILQKLGEDHELDLTEFQQWLNVATAEEEDGGGVERMLEKEEPPAASTKKDEPKPPSSSERPQKRKVVDARRSFQKIVWSEYLKTGKHGSDLFVCIDLNKNRTISVSEIDYFLDTVDRRGVKEEKFDELRELGNDKELNEEEFLEWLSKSVEVEGGRDGA